MFSLRTKSKTIMHALTAMLLLFVAVAVMTHGGLMSAQTVNWVEMGSPSARSSISMAYDGATLSTVLFGGDHNDHEDVGDTWVWRGGWLRASPATSPSPRNAAGMAYDAAAGNIRSHPDRARIWRRQQHWGSGRHLDVERDSQDLDPAESRRESLRARSFFGVRRGDPERYSIWRRW